MNSGKFNFHFYAVDFATDDWFEITIACQHCNCNNPEEDFHGFLKDEFEEKVPPKTFEEWERKKVYPKTNRKIYKLEDMKTYPGRKKINQIRKLGALHKEADEIVTKLTKDFINSIDYDNHEEGKSENTFHNFTFP